MFPNAITAPGDAIVQFDVTADQNLYYGHDNCNAIGISLMRIAFYRDSPDDRYATVLNFYILLYYDVLPTGMFQGGVQIPAGAEPGVYHLHITWKSMQGM